MLQNTSENDKNSIQMTCAKKRYNIHRHRITSWGVAYACPVMSGGHVGCRVMLSCAGYSPGHESAYTGDGLEDGWMGTHHHETARKNRDHHWILLGRKGECRSDSSRTVCMGRAGYSRDARCGVGGPWAAMSSSLGKTDLRDVFPYVENGGCTKVGVIGDWGGRQEPMLTLGWGRSGGAVGARIIVVLVLSVVYMGVVSTPEEVLLSLLLLDVDALLITPPARPYSSCRLHVPASSPLFHSPAPFSTMLLLCFRTLSAFPVIVIVALLGVALLVVNFAFHNTSCPEMAADIDSPVIIRTIVVHGSSIRLRLASISMWGVLDRTEQTT
ncbi:uncharacterized protein EV420DRAFT_1081545 [Desarmillaria tabescens]|uniref:Uncharacterized protein n=1 Tax=Armillaria tabescens TaxID=1929756 RepID=A0AA39JGD0_ARMTA|nr:uncharacterized protein EV420DRAFT_1081545 [Desarmillaria tabescens]KAK0442300.1 hypothetical protein EV420DRAFT_1081545 [Desarmillaria tabescens]